MIGIMIVVHLLIRSILHLHLFSLNVNAVLSRMLIV